MADLIVIVEPSVISAVVLLTTSLYTTAPETPTVSPLDSECAKLLNKPPNLNFGFKPLYVDVILCSASPVTSNLGSFPSSVGFGRTNDKSHLPLASEENFVPNCKFSSPHILKGNLIPNVSLP